MKKFLALVLALIMTMSLVTISAGAEDFTDDASITYEEAVDVMTALGIVGGYTDGSFNPNGTLTRGAAAKIICNMILGPTAAGELATVEAPFSDVPADHVFSGYIAYCVSEGIVGGYTDGTFKPAGTLTGYAFMKMLLGALGYDAVTEGYTGANFAVNVAKRALNIGLDDGLKGDFVGSKALTREEACLYAFNALQATMVEYENASSIKIGDIEISNSSKAKAVTDGNVTGIWDETGTDTLQFAEKYFGKLKYQAGTDAFGRPAMTWWYGVKNDTDKIGQYVNATPIATFEGVTSEKAVYEAIGGDGADEAIAQIYEDGALKAGYTFTKAVTNNAPYFGNGVKAEIYDVTPTGATSPTYRLVAVRDYLATVTGVNKANEDTDTKRSVNITLATVPSGFESTKTCAAYETEDFAKKDVLVVNVSTMTGEAVVKAAQLAEKLEDQTVTAYKQGGMDKGYVMIDGVKYAYSQNFTENSNTKTYDMTSGSTHNFWLDTYGNILKTEGYEATTEDYYRVVAKGASEKTDGFGGGQYFEYKVVDMTGTVSVVKALNTKADGAADGYILTMKDDVDNDGYKVFTVLDNEYTSSDADTAGYKNASGVTGFSKNSAKIGDIVVNNKTVFVLHTGDNKFKVVEGLNNMDTYTGLTSQLVCSVMKKGVAQVVYMDVAAGTASTTVDNLVYIKSATPAVSYDTTNKCAVYTYAAIVDGVDTTIATKEDTVYVGLNKITKMSDGYVADDGLTLITDAADKYAVKSISAKEVTFEEGILTIDGVTYVISADVVVTAIDKAGAVTFDAGIDAVTGDSVTADFYMIETSTTNATVTAIYFDAN